MNEHDDAGLPAFTGTDGARDLDAQDINRAALACGWHLFEEVRP